MSKANRRDIIAAAGAASIVGGPLLAGAVTGAADDGSRGVRAAFDAMVTALVNGDLDGFFGCMHARFVMIDEDSPWRLGKAAFQEHIGFHLSGIWESFAWVPGEVTSRAFGRTGIVAGTAMFRGKPKDAGFRLRPLLFMQAWVHGRDGWRLLNWHQSPTVGRVTGASPA